MKIETLFRLSDTDLKTTLYKMFLKCGYEKNSLTNTPKFLYAEGDAPYMLVAHLDTVHATSPSLICYSKDGNYMMSPQGIGGDDRCGVYIILSLLTKLPFKPYVLFTMEEETGGRGAQAFNNFIAKCGNEPDLKFIVEYDRKGGDDCVFYQCGNAEFVTFVEKFGFKSAYGTFTDISTIAPKLGVAAVNLSSGYYNPHTNHEVVCISDMERTIARSVEMLTAECDKFKYVAKYANYQSRYERRQVKVCFVPKNTLWLYSYVTRDYVPNKEDEVVMDDKGFFYRNNRTYGDISTLPRVELIEGAEEPVYDENTAVLMTVFGY